MGVGVDMLFCARQLVEKAYECNSKMFLLFIDLHKAYDLTPRQTMWKVLAKYGIPQVMIRLLRSLHEGMLGQVIVGSDRSTMASDRDAQLLQRCSTYFSTWSSNSGKVSVRH